MNNYRNMMRRMRQYTAAVEKNYNRRAVELEKEADKKGSIFYDRYAAEVDRKIESERVRLGTEVQKDLVGMVETMRKNVSNRITKAPTADMVNTLSLLRILDTVNPTEIKEYAAQMADCPLAMQALSQIAEKHNIRTAVPNTEDMMRAVDVIEGNLANYIQNFRGTSDMSPSVKMLHDLYFQPEEYYTKTDAKSSETADAAFWKDVVMIGTPDMLDEGDSAGKAINVKYFFGSLDGLIDYIGTKTAGLEDKAKEDKINEILADCPGQYGAAYRNYVANGEKVPLLEEGEML